MNVKPAWQLAVHDNAMNIVDHINNDVPGSLKYYDEEFHQYCGKGSATFTFTVDKYSNGVLNERIANLTTESYISFHEDDTDYVFNVMTRRETDYTITLECVTTNLELLNEKVVAYESKDAKSFLEYIEAMQLFKFTRIELGICEIRNTKQTLKFESDDDTCLARILKLVEAFDGEMEIITKLADGGQIDKYILNVYKSRNVAKDNEPGLGRVRTDIRLQMGRDVASVIKKEDKTNLFSAIRMRNKDGAYITFPNSREIKAADGTHVEMYCNRGSHTIYAPISAKLYPSVNKRDNCDPWIVRDVKTEFTNADEAWAYGVKMLRNYMYPITTWEISLNSAMVLQRYDIKIGDVIFMTDENFVGGLLIRARVIEMVRCSTDHSKTKLTLSNVVAIRPTNNSTLMNTMSRMINDAQPFKMTVKTTGPTMFRELTDSCELIPTLYKGKSEVTDVDFSYFIDNNLAGSGTRFRASRSNVGTSGNALITIQAWVQGQMVEFQDVTIATVNDGVSPVLTTIESSNGDVFKNGVIDTVLTAKLFRDDVEIDTHGEAFNYIWTKTNANGEVDEPWGQRPESKKKSISVTRIDVEDKATFSVAITTKNGAVSTDPTKYKRDDTVGNTKVIGRNLWVNGKCEGYAAIEKLPENHITGQTECYRIESGQKNNLRFNIAPDFTKRFYKKLTMSAWVKYENVKKGANPWQGFNCFKSIPLERRNSKTNEVAPIDYLGHFTFDGSSDWKRIEVTYDYGSNPNYDELKMDLRFILEDTQSGTAWITGVKVEEGTVATDYSLSPEDKEGGV